MVVSRRILALADCVIAELLEIVIFVKALSDDAAAPEVGSCALGYVPREGHFSDQSPRLLPQEARSQGENTFP